MRVMSRVDCRVLAKDRGRAGVLLDRRWGSAGKALSSRGMLRAKIGCLIQQRPLQRRSHRRAICEYLATGLTGETSSITTHLCVRRGWGMIEITEPLALMLLRDTRD